jgi:hypothetical protein
MAVLLPVLCTQTSEATYDPKGYSPVQMPMIVIDSFIYEILLQQCGYAICSFNILRPLTFMTSVGE